MIIKKRSLPSNNMPIFFALPAAGTYLGDTLLLPAKPHMPSIEEVRTAARVLLGRAA
jgi:hypothetical protein